MIQIKILHKAMASYRERVDSGISLNSVAAVTTHMNFVFKGPHLWHQLVCICTKKSIKSQHPADV